mmetsp:Transcript_32804/g.101715  ORF Transcript_32804/g.101715 Transcript_32804/m.101715 type:complete len:365 (+) Transcript_32804:1-1095(+)
MVDRAHALGLRAGWYMGNYQCGEGMGGLRWNLTRLAEGSVRAVREYGFESVKLDSGFPVGKNLSLWAQLLNSSGRPVMIENCHQGAEGPGMDDPNSGRCTGLGEPSDCPFNFWRTTGDPEPDWRTIMRELNSLRKVENAQYPSGKRKGAPEYNSDPPLSRPGAWAYPGTMVVGDGSLTKDENRVHFGAWCIVSSPLILAYNLSSPAERELVWDIVTNKEAIQVNQALAGHPGRQVLVGLGSNGAVEVWAKPVGEAGLAVLVVNTEDRRGGLRGPAPPPPAASVAIELTALNVSGRRRVRDVWAKRYLPDAEGTLSVRVPYHACAFFVLVPPGVPWPVPFRLAPWMRDRPGARPTSAPARGELFA